jgi:hypothetical protein
MHPNLSVKSLLLVVASACIITMVKAQTNNEVAQQPAPKSCSCSFASILQGGILKGEQGSYGLLQTINGIRYKTWFAGIGAGLDFYTYKGIPVFLDVRRSLFNKLSSPFIYADGGIYLDHLNNESSPFITQRFKNGSYFDVGAGYTIGLGRKTVFVLGAGYSYKYIRMQQTFKGCDGYPCGVAQSTNNYDWAQNRLSLKMGFMF